MSVAKRRFDDPRNTYIVSNNDPGAFDKSHAGKAGTHTEQRCCSDRAPYAETLRVEHIRKTTSGETIPLYLYHSEQYSGRNWYFDKVLGVNKQQPAGGVYDHRDGRMYQTLPEGWTSVGLMVDPRQTVMWCHECETYLEKQWAANWIPMGGYAASFVRGLAMVVSYVPVFGTAVAFVLNAGVSLAEGAGIDEAALDGIGQSLPGQPVSGAVFNGTRALISGKRIDAIAIEALPVTPDVKKALSSAVSIVEAVASGQRLDSAAMNAIYDHLPPKGQRAMSLARRLANGENVGEAALKEALAAQPVQDARRQLDGMKAQWDITKGAGQQAVNRFIVEAGYQGAVNSLPAATAEALTAGLAVGRAEWERSRGPSVQANGLWDSAERDKARNDALAEKGRVIVNSGALWKPGYSLYDVRNRTKVWIARTENRVRYDSLTGKNVIGDWAEIEESVVTPEWQRGFDIGIGLCEGMSLDGPGQQKVLASLVIKDRERGFLAAQRIQYERTKRAQLTKGLDTMAMALGRVISALDRQTLVDNAAKGAAMVNQTPQIAAARALNSDPRFRWGFDVATGLCEGMWMPGPGQTSWRVKVGPFSHGSSPDGLGPGSSEAMRGFDVGQALQHGISKARNANQAAAMAAQPPNVAAGMLLAGGIAGSGSPADIKVGVISETLSQSDVKAGARTVLEEKGGFWAKVKKFFGL